MVLSETELLIAAIISQSLGGAWGARRAGAEAWRGAVVIFLAITGVAVAFNALGVGNVLLATICQIFVAGIVGAVLKLTPRQISMTIIGALLLLVVFQVVATYAIR